MSTTNKTIDSYNKFAGKYSSYVNNISNFYNMCIEVPVMEELIKSKVVNKKVLDLGCGSGTFSNKLKNWGADVKGIDVSIEMIEEAKKAYSDIDFKVGDAEKLPYESKTFDFVTSSLVMHYMQDLNYVFAEVARVLKENGIFIFSMHHPMFKNHRTIMVDGKKEKILKPYFNNGLYEWSMFNSEMVVHSYHHTFEDIIGNLIKNGFNITKLIEPRPTESSKDQFPEDFEKASNYPTFVIIEVKKS